MTTLRLEIRRYGLYQMLRRIADNRLGDTLEDLEQHALPGTVAPDHVHDLAALDLEGDISQNPQAGVVTVPFIVALLAGADVVELA